MPKSSVEASSDCVIAFAITLLLDIHLEDVGHLPQGDLIGKKLIIQGFWMYYKEFLPKIRAAVTEAAQVVASGRLSLSITATYKPFQIKEAIEHYQRGTKVLLDFTHAN
jgi:hypothetical protein